MHEDMQRFGGTEEDAGDQVRDEVNSLKGAKVPLNYGDIVIFQGSMP